MTNFVSLYLIILKPYKLYIGPFALSRSKAKRVFQHIAKCIPRTFQSKSPDVKVANFGVYMNYKPK